MITVMKSITKTIKAASRKGRTSLSCRFDVSGVKPDRLLQSPFQPG